MPSALRYDHDKKILFVTVTGAFPLDEFRAVMEQITHSDEYPPDTDALWDLREMELQSVESAFFRGVIAVRKQFPQRGTARMAHIVSGDFAYGMLRMYEILSETDRDNLPQGIMVFKSCAEGEAWLLGR